MMCISLATGADAMPLSGKSVRFCGARRCAIIPIKVIHRQEVRPVNAISVVGALLRSTIARLT